MKTHPKIRAAAIAISKEAAGRGQLIDIGWRSYAVVMTPASTPEELEKFRYAYYSGAEHLFMSIMDVMDDDREPTDRDLEVMQKISREIEAFQRELEGYIALHKTPTRGTS